LFLQIDRVGGDDRLLLLLERIKNRRGQIRDRFPDAGPRLDHQVPLFFERPGHPYRHLLLLPAILEIFSVR
jgi:hypothetical protein